MLVEAIVNNSRGTKLDVDVSIEKFLGKTKKISCLSNSLSWISTDKASHISKKNLDLLEDSSYHITVTVYSYGSYVRPMPVLYQSLNLNYIIKKEWRITISLL